MPTPWNFIQSQLRRHAILAGVSLAAGALVSGPLPACAQQSADPSGLLRRVQELEKELAQIKSELRASIPPAEDTSAASLVAASAALLRASASAAPATQAANPAVHAFFEKKPGRDLTFSTPSGQFTLYGNLDISIDAATKGTSSFLAPDGSSPVGEMGWQPDLSTNLSYIGIRGRQKLARQPFDFIYQMETQVDIASSSGLSESNSNDSNVVKGGLTSRNTFLGLASGRFGSLMFGKTDTPYKLTTLRMNPFYAMLGDYAVIMGNTGGDNRVEFATRLDHSLWWASPASHGLAATILFSPGQNRSSDSDNIAAGESDCTGGNIPGSGGSLPYACNDGSFSDAVSASLAYTREPFYLTAAYERHQKVNRSSDLTGEYATPPPGFMAADTADEDAGKVGAQYTLPSKTTVSGIFETMHRYVPAFLAFQNERQRTGYWLSLTQAASKSDSFSVGWARANRTPGDPGQHNTSTALPPQGSPGDGTGGPNVDNTASLVTFAFRRKLAEGLTAYFDWAGTFNGPYAHYDLGAGGRSVTIDCHDASDATGGESSNPHCWAGGRLQGISLGLNRRF